jgi:uncharacterized protein YneF (UPF0154 family)
MKRWLAGICGVALLLIVGVIGYFWIAGFSMAVELLQGTPLYLEHAEHQFQVNYWVVLFVLTICPVAFSIFGIWLLRRAICRHEHVA